MKAIILSLDKQLLAGHGDSLERMKRYAGLFKSLDIIVFSQDRVKPLKVQDGLVIYSTGSRSRLASLYKAIGLTSRIIGKNNEYLVIAQDPFYTGACAWWLKKKFPIKTLISVYGTNIYDPGWLRESCLNRILKPIGNAVMKSADAIQTDGFETVDELKSIYGAKVFWKPIIPSNIEDFRSLTPKNYDGQIGILFVGRMVKQKNIPMLISVIEEMARKYQKDRIKFKVVGDGELSDYFQSAVKSKSLAEYIDYHPRLERSEILETYGNSHILILTSYYEGFAKVFMEAAAAGLPIITTKVSGVKNLVDDNVNGFVVDHDDAKALAERLGSLIDDRATLAGFSDKMKNGFWQKYNSNLTIEIQKQINDFLESGQN
jgi:glycosyltransferase involved in cell wall biosynthesis